MRVVTFGGKRYDARPLSESGPAKCEGSPAARAFLASGHRELTPKTPHTESNLGVQAPSYLGLH